MDENKIALLGKILAVQRTVSYLRKDKRGHQFQYVGSSDALGVIRPAMDMQGLLLEPRNAVVRCNQDHKTRKGDAWYRCEIWIDYWWVDAETGAERGPFPWYGMGLDDSEKAPGKAATYAEKMFLLKFFHIATDQLDPDSFQRRADAAAQKPQEPKPKPQPKPSAPKSTDEPATKPQLARLEQLLDFATSTPKAGKVASKLKAALDGGKLTKAAAGALVGKAKAALGPHGWDAEEARIALRAGDEPPPPEPKECIHSWEAGVCIHCGAVDDDDLPF